MKKKEENMYICLLRYRVCYIYIIDLVKYKN